MKKKILILSPHCDDEILGCGGTISKYSKKTLFYHKSIDIRICLLILIFDGGSTRFPLPLDVDALAQSHLFPRSSTSASTSSIHPQVITYSTMLKGYCQAGEVDVGFQILEKMQKEARLRPDEIMFNSLLDGC